MTLLLQAAPLLALVALLASGRVGPVPACLVALALAVPAALASLPTGAGFGAFLAQEVPRGVYLALQPVLVVSGGLLFHAAVARPATEAAARTPTAARLFAVTLPLGVFLESVTGFAVGAVFALSALRTMGVGGPVAGAMALTGLVLVPWGGLGPGTLIGAALSHQPVQVLAMQAAWPNAAWLVLLAPTLWALQRSAGVAVRAQEKAVQLGLLALMAALLLLCNRFLPFEVAGILSAGPVMVLALWRADPPRDKAAALRLALPYIALTLLLLVARSWPHPPAFHPFADYPAFPLTHVAVVLWLFSAVLLWRQPGGWGKARGALLRARRPALAMLLYVVLGRLLAGSGAAQALASATAEALGGAAPYAIPLLAMVAGLVTGSNVGSNAALMPIQVGLGQAAGLPPTLAPMLHIFAGSAGSAVSFGVCALVCGLLADGTRPAQLWRLLAPALLLIPVLGWAALLVLR